MTSGRKLLLSEAAKRADRTKMTLLQAIRRGRLSAEAVLETGEVIAYEALDPQHVVARILIQEEDLERYITGRKIGRPRKNETDVTQIGRRGARSVRVSQALI